MATVQVEIAFPTRELSKRHVLHADHVECVVYESGDTRVHVCPTQIEITSTEEQTTKLRKSLDAYVPVSLQPELQDLEIAEQLQAELAALESARHLTGSTLEDVLLAYSNTLASEELWTFSATTLADLPVKHEEVSELQIEIVP